MTSKSSVLDLDAQIQALMERKRLLIVKSAERFARAATKSGVAEMEITDTQIDTLFNEIAARFRRQTKETTLTTSKTSQPADHRSGTTKEHPHVG
ncbi:MULTISPECIES: TraC family protein [Rhizobium]|uniref:TraC family protein n=1 Tax=Rhizobium TaxID=379 RepID=UPI001957387C|nr:MULTISPECIES: TraC family protein [Rhizobium]MBM7045727.1 TraC family protein [Rhizobium lusitanum]